MHVSTFDKNGTEPCMERFTKTSRVYQVLDLSLLPKDSRNAVREADPYGSLKQGIALLQGAIKYLKGERVEENWLLHWASDKRYTSTRKARHGSCGSGFASTTSLDTQALLVALMDVMMNRLGEPQLSTKPPKPYYQPRARQAVQAPLKPSEPLKLPSSHKAMKAMQKETKESQHDWPPKF
ncbi:hypothetical protein VNO77_15502 [Canavalia gladiata]|uniref:Uncharacterized protein n=1 Tax=Canavalia gladiata TaxID=3824 RepID=A0AAN9LZL9_CANGL